MAQYGIKYMSHTNRDEEADEKFVELVKTVSGRKESMPIWKEKILNRFERMD